jgi:hypothetical protein
MESYLNCDDIAEKSPQLQFKGNMTMSAVISHDSRS